MWLRTWEELLKASSHAEQQNSSKQNKQRKSLFQKLLLFYYWMCSVSENKKIYKILQVVEIFIYLAQVSDFFSPVFH